MADHDVNDLREQLRALGYLDARVDRFVLGGASARRSAVALAAGASARIGLLAAVLLGPAAAIGTAARMPGLITRLSDAVVLAGYLAICFGAATALAAFILILPAGSIARRSAARADFARRARVAAAGAGIAIGLASLAYLTLWWGVASNAGAQSSIGGTATMLAVAVAISLLLGHVVMITALAYVARLGLALPRGGASASWRLTAPLAIVALAGAGALLAATTPPSPPAPPPLAVVSAGERVIVIAIDGADQATLARVMANHQMPALAKITAVSATMPSDPNRDPARVWTTIATGQPPEKHGINALEVTQLAGVEGRLGSASGAASTIKAATDMIQLTRPAIASGQERRLPTFWEVAARAGLRTAVIHWWATWPADADAGTVISDRAVLRLERGGALDGEIAPASLYEKLRADADARHARATAIAGTVAPASSGTDVAGALRRSAELDATLIDLASDPALGPVDLLALYLPGLDIAQHALLTSETGAALPASAMAERVSALESYYAFLDRALAPLISRADAPGTIVMLVTQPGRVSQPGAGVFAMSSAGLTAQTPANATPEWIAPAVLFALGVPIAGDLPAASAPSSIFPAAFLAAHPERMVATYGSRHTSNVRGSGRPLDQEMIERMRSLGYVR